MGTRLARVTCETNQVLLAGGQVALLGDLPCSSHLTIDSAQPVLQCPMIGFHKQGCQILMKLFTYVAHMALLQEMEYFKIWTSTSGVRAPSVAEASFYSLEDKLLCNFG